MRKIPAALLSLALTASLTAPLASAAGTGSTLPELDGHWSQSAFERWHAYGIVEGDSRGMRPDANMTVGEFAAILSRAMGYTETVENPYADLKGTEWYAPYILQLTAAGILQGDGTNCNAEEPMNRERATVLFARALGIRPTAQPDLSGFVDGKDTADWSAGYIDAMAKDGIIQGVGNQTLALGSSITRGSVVKILDSSVAEYAVEEGATIDQDVDGILLVAADDITVDGAAVSGNLLVAPKAGEANLTVKNARLERDLRVSTHGATLTVADSQVEGDVALSGDRASLTLGSGAQLARLAVDGAGSSVSVKSGASVETLTARAAVKVDNQGAINKAEVQADNVVLDGKRPAHVEVADDVAPPQNSEGEEVTGSEDSQEPGQGGGGSGGGGGSVSEEAVAGIVGVRPVDQDGVEEDMPSVTAKATKKTGENFVRIALSTDGVVPIHQSEGAGKGAWVGVAIEAPEGYEQGTFQYHFGTEASAEATQSAAITEDSSIGQGKYAVFFLNASSTAPKTHITVKWEGQEAVQYVVDLSGVQTPAVKLTGVTVSTHEMPSGVSSTAEGLSFDGSTALVQNGGSGTLTHTQVASMGGGGEYTVYYTVPQAIPGGTLQFDKIARSVNGGKWNTWAMPSTTEANAGSGWWTRDGENYYFKWGAVFAEEAEGSYRLKDGGVFDYTLCFIDTDGSQDNIIATYTFQIDLSGYTITADE
ncbi:S-layer homology domain-containing protein [Flavonifractor plautii]|uniref:S-layer homology domain-containing protein n=1 Tax=Flavonifractor plautii TaxID=292800 RepID=UPI00189B7E0E|nr:S-layer homology domain-containing protein [Flavonifractor plautii]MDB7873986.1 S-layer homology domain-containing protein [Flavonifractor plautii]